MQTPSTPTLPAADAEVRAILERRDGENARAQRKRLIRLRLHTTAALRELRPQADAELELEQAERAEHDAAERAAAARAQLEEGLVEPGA